MDPPFVRKFPCIQKNHVRIPGKRLAQFGCFQSSQKKKKRRMENFSCHLMEGLGTGIPSRPATTTTSPKKYNPPLHPHVKPPMIIQINQLFIWII